MRTLLLAAAVAASAFVFVPNALAKGALELCGADGCAFLAAEGPTGPPIPLGGRASEGIAPAAPAAFYTITFAEFAGEPVAYWIPAVGVVRARGSASGAIWLTVAADARALLDRAAAELHPFAAPATASVLVGGRLASDGASYLSLYTIGTPTYRWPRTVTWLQISIFAPAATPWTDGVNSLWISRKGSYLRRDGQVVRISPTLARRIRARLSLR